MFSVFLCIAPGAPRNVSFSNLTSSSVILYWESPPASEHNGVIRFYELNVSDSQSDLSVHFTTIDTKYTLIGLEPYHWYIVQVSAVTIRTGEPSSQLILRTLEDCEFQLSVINSLIYIISYIVILYRSLWTTT